MNVCEMCSSEYKPTRNRQKYCSLQCYFKTKIKTPVVKKCINCGNTFEINRRNSTANRDSRVYCSQDCAFHNSDRNKKISVARLGKFTGAENGKWKGGKTICNGYARISKTGERIHRMVMEGYLGRKLTREEIVHHIDGNKLDNRIENLQVMTNIEHCKHHKKGIKIVRDKKGRIVTYSI